MSNKNHTAVKKSSHYLLFCFCALMCLAACSKDDGLVYPPNVADAIPDGEFRVLCLQIADTNHDGTISKEEALAVTKIDCTPKASYVQTIESLEGLHYFANLEELHCKIQRLASLDVSGNPRLRVIGCAFNPLTTLDVSMCTQLEMLVCCDCRLETLRLPRTATLTALDCSGNRLGALDVTEYPALSALYCDGNLFTKVDLHSNPELMALRCSDIDGLDISENPKLENLICSGGAIGQLDLSHSAALRKLSIYDVQMTSIEFAEASAIEELSLQKTECERLDLNRCPRLRVLRISEVPLRELALPERAYGNIVLEKIPIERLAVKCVFDGTGYTNLRLDGCERLQRIEVVADELMFDCKNCPSLSALDLDGCRALKQCTCTGTALSSLDLSQVGNPELYIICRDNRLTSLLLPSAFYALRCSGNLLEELDISNCWIGTGGVECLPMETLQRIRLRRDQEWILKKSTGVELVYVD